MILFKYKAFMGVLKCLFAVLLILDNPLVVWMRVSVIFINVITAN